MASRTHLQASRVLRASRPLGVTALAGIVALLATVAMAVPLASPVAAHVELEGSEPSAGAEVETEPKAVQLIFSGSVQSDGAEVAVTSPDDTQLGDGEPEVSDDTVTQPLASLPGEGSYTVSYRVVSADGHPVSDTFTFDYAPPKEKIGRAHV